MTIDKDPGSLQVSCPCYRMDGTLWHEMTTLSGPYIHYMLRHPPDLTSPVGQQIDNALSRYRETVRGLVSAGF